MPIKYNDIKPWGRSYSEYRKMFNLTKNELNLKILGVGDGPASFNAKMTKQGKKVVSVDPHYKFSKANIEAKINESYDDILTQTKNNQDKFLWDKIKSPEELGKIRLHAMKIFLADFELGKIENRYLEAKLPNLPFKDQIFDLALCSHFLFLYTDNLSLDFHFQAIKEMLRVAKEVRIFPILDCNAQESKYLIPLKERLNSYLIQTIKVGYEFQRNGNQMLKITKNNLNIKILKAELEDAEEILKVQKLAFTPVARFHNDFKIAPLTETLENLKEQIQKWLVLKAVLEDKIIGTVRAYEKGNTCYIFKLAVEPDYQKQGIGKKLMVQIENSFPNVKRYELFTGKKMTQYIKLYNQLGYIEFKKEKVNEKVTLVYMEK